jgi:hypothetical protein
MPCDLAVEVAGGRRREQAGHLDAERLFAAVERADA